MTLKEKLDRFKKKMGQQIPEGALKIMNEATEELRSSGILDRHPKVGEAAPDLELQFSEGRTQQLSELVKEGPVVLSFYRGIW